MIALFTREQITEISRLADAAWPNEACGLVVGADWSHARHVPLENLQERYHARDPVQYPRTARTAYLMHPLKVAEAVDGAGGLLAIWHSHCDVGAYFSDEDVRVALGGGAAPLWPGAVYLVLSVRAGQTDGAKVFAWDPASGTFRGSDVAFP